ncbi:MAG: glycosyltransferase family 4 protein [Leptolyngbya sp. BL-A-14]
MVLSQKLKVLMVVEQCNPDWTSVPLEGYQYFHAISKLADVTLVTHERNRKALEKNEEDAKFVYVKESNFITKYSSFSWRLAAPKGRVIWPLLHALGLPVHLDFNQKVFAKFKDRIQAEDYDLVHVLTPMEPRYPFKIATACRDTPFILGPVNGGVPFPSGFRSRAKREFAQLNFLRVIGRWLVPGYAETYKKADRILGGSTYTLNLIKSLFKLPDQKVSLFYENGVPDCFLNVVKQAKSTDVINLLFVGRLVPYKCADIVIDALGCLEPSIQAKVKLTIVGDGTEKSFLESKVQALGLEHLVLFTGLVDQQQILKYYSEGDIFCFPSIREYGGAVVLEAMACGLPCIVANNGGIGEYVTESTGFKIEPLSKEHLTQELAAKINLLVQDHALRQRMSVQSVLRAQEFTWKRKAEKMLDVYQEVVRERLPSPLHNTASKVSV